MSCEEYFELEDISEEDQNKMMRERSESRDEVTQQVKENVEKAQKKQQETYAKRKSHGVKEFDLKIGMKVFKRNNKNVARKGGKMQDKWLGPYVISGITDNKGVQLIGKNRGMSTVAWEQVVPVNESDLHDRNAGNAAMMVEDSAGIVETAPIVIDSDQPYSVDKVAVIKADKQSFKDLITNKEVWLDDYQINLCQDLIKGRYKIGSMQSVLHFQDYKSEISFVRPTTEPFIQIINVRRSHWITLSNIGELENVVNVYDSQFYEFTGDHMCNLWHWVAQLIKTDECEIILRFNSVQQQTEYSDCGYFAIAFAMTLINQKDPREFNYQQRVMRQHLSNCVDNSCMEEFPSTGVLREHTGYLDELRGK